MSDRRGIERLRWLESESNMAQGHGGYPPIPLTHLQVSSDKEVMVEVAYALIEELHDAMVAWSHPMIVVKAPE